LRASFRTATRLPVPDSDSRASTWVRFPLVAVLAVVASGELLVNRIFGQLLQVDPLQPRAPWRRALLDVRLFLYELTAVLAVLLLASALARVATHGDRYRDGARVSFALVGLVCVGLAALGAIGELPPDLYFHLHLSYTFLALLVCMSVVAARAPARIRLGTLILFLPTGLHFAARLLRRLTPAPELLSTPLELETIAQATLAAAAVVAIPCFASRRHGFRLAMALAATLVGAAAILIRIDWEMAARVAKYGFGVILPMAPWALLVYLVAVGSFVFTVVTLLSSTGAERLRGYGLLFYGLSGLEYQAPFQMALGALGLLCIAESVVRVVGPTLDREGFENLVRRGAAAVGAPQVVLTGASGFETVRLHSPGTATPVVALIIARHAGQVATIDIVVGEEMPRDPPFTLERRHTERLGPRADGPAIETGDPRFDAAFVTRDRRGLNARLLDDAIRVRLHDLCAGWLGVWPQRGVRYRAQTLGGGGEDALPLLIELLRELAGRASS
jgi:hypothetical protein